MKELFDPCGPYVPMWSTIFAISMVIAVSIDPLFLYIPILDEDKKCLGMDRKLKMITVVLRFVADLPYIMHIIFEIRHTFMVEAANASKRNTLVKNTTYFDTVKRIRWSCVLIDFLAILPLPQVLILTYFSKMRSLKSLGTSKFINLVILAQYVPRVLRLYLSCQILRTGNGSTLNRIIPIGAILNIVLYIVASHVLGALWYFFSIQRETACWHHACKEPNKCLQGDSFICRRDFTSPDTSYLSRVCSANPPNITLFDYGIFTDAVQSGILLKTSFLKKFIRCFWWGLRNVSSFGQNLQTSTNEWETCFAASISIIAILLFIYLIGNLQMYFQLATARSEEVVERMKRMEQEVDFWILHRSLPAHEKAQIMQRVQRALTEDRESFDLAVLRSLFVDRVDRRNNNLIEEGGLQRPRLVNMQEHKVEEWILRNQIPDEIKQNIMPYVRPTLRENEDVNLKIMLSILPEYHKTALKKHLCLAMLKRVRVSFGTVPMLCELDDNVVETICDYLKPMIYPENSYIVQQGEPLDLMFFITDGIAWTYGASNVGEISISSTSCLQRGEFYGNKELLQWTCDNISLSNIPVSTTNIKAHTKVEALALMAKDLRDLVSSTSTSFCTIQIQAE